MLRRSARRKRCRTGLTLIEAIALICVLSIATPAMMWSLAIANDNRTVPLMAGRARFLASEMLEGILVDRFAVARGYAYVVAANYPAESAVIGFPRFARSVSISETARNMTGAGTGSKTVTVSVVYPTSRGSRTLSLSTIMTDF